MAGGLEAEPRRRLGLVALIAGVALVLGVLAMRDRGGPESGPAASVRPAEPPKPAVVGATSPDRPLDPARTLELERAAFPTSGPVRVRLGLAEPSADAEPRPVRLVSQPDHRILELAGVLEADRRAATIEVDPGYFQPGTYLVEMKTTERGVFPLRRYFIIVR